MNQPIELIDFPDLPDEAVIAINDFIEELYARFQSRYFSQMHRYYHDRPTASQDLNQLPLPLPLPDPPF